MRVKRGSATAPTGSARGQAAGVRHALARTLTRRVEALAGQLPGALKGDVDAVHDARVATRRLREVVPIVTVGHEDRKSARLRRRLRKLTRALGPVRELDVASKLFDDREGRRRSPGVAALRRHLRDERDKAFERLERAFDRPRAERLLARLGKLDEHLREGPDMASDADLERARRALADSAIERARQLGDAIAASGAIFIVERVHAVRIAAKRLRYALELAGELRLVPTGALVSRLRRIQDVLGDLHDLDVLRIHANLVRAELPAGSPAAAELERQSETLAGEARELHAGYLRKARGLVHLTDRVRDRVAPCLDPSIST
jgi:CHAD domain-containing protein